MNKKVLERHFHSYFNGFSVKLALFISVLAIYMIARWL